jgi:putative oxidoreductase
MTTRNIGLLALRAGVGGALVAHGVQKLRNRDGATAGFRAMGFPEPAKAVTAATACEVGGGALLVAGLATPAAAGAAIGAMGVASDVGRANGFFNQDGGFEYTMNLAVAAGAIALAGPGACSVDHLLGYRLARPWMAVTAIVAGIAGAVAVARTRRSAPSGTEAAADDDPVSVSGRGELLVTESAQTPL